MRASSLTEYDPATSIAPERLRLGVHHEGSISTDLIVEIRSLDK